MSSDWQHRSCMGLSRSIYNALTVTCQPSSVRLLDNTRYTCHLSAVIVPYQSLVSCHCNSVNAPPYSATYLNSTFCHPLTYVVVTDQIGSILLQSRSETIVCILPIIWIPSSFQILTHWLTYWCMNLGWFLCLICEGNYFFRFHNLPILWWTGECGCTHPLCPGSGGCACPI